MNRYTVVPNHASARNRGWLIHDTKRNRTLQAPTYPGYWLDELEAVATCEALNLRELGYQERLTRKGVERR